MKNKIIVISAIGLTSLLIFIILTIILNNNSFYPTSIDKNVFNYFLNNRGEKNNGLYWSSRIITELGGPVFVIGMAVALLIYTKGDNRFFSFALGALIMITTNLLLKDIFSRIRPDEALWWIKERDLSYPSGHSAATGFMYAFLIYFIYDLKINKKYKIIGYVICAILLIIVPMTRLIFCVHYLTDIIAGLLTGFICATLAILFNLLLIKYEIFKKPILISIYEEFKNNKDKNN